MTFNVLDGLILIVFVLILLVVTGVGRASQTGKLLGRGGNGEKAGCQNCQGKSGEDGCDGRNSLKPADFWHSDILSHFLLVYSIRVRCTKLPGFASQVKVVAVRRRNNREFAGTDGS